MEVERLIDPIKYFEDSADDDDDVFSVAKVLKRRLEVLKVIQLDVRKTVWSIAMTKLSTVWVSVGDMPLDGAKAPFQLYQIKTSGDVICQIEVDFWPYYIAVRNDNSLLVSSGWSSSIIRHVDDQHKISTFAELSPYWVYGIFVDNEDQVLACLHSKDQYDARVILISPASVLLREITVDQFGQWMFNHPFSISITPNGDLLFKDGKALLSLHTSGLTFKSTRPMSGEWNVKRFLCDRFGNVIGGSQESLHVIDISGKWISSFYEDILAEKTVHGLGVSADDSLWIGTNSGEIMKLKYLE